MIFQSVSKLNSNFQRKSPANRFAESPCPAPSACHDQSDDQDDQSGDQSCDGIFLLKINIIPIIQNPSVEKRTEKLSTKQPCVYCFVACPIFKYILILMITYVCTPLLPSSPELLPKKIRKATAPSSRSTSSSRPCPGSTGSTPSTRRRSKAPARQAPPKAPRAPRAPKARRGTGALPDPRPPKKWGPRWSKMVELGEKVMKYDEILF